MSIIYISLLNCHVIFKLAESGLWKHCSPPHVSPMHVCSKCYPRSLITGWVSTLALQRIRHLRHTVKGVEGLVSLSTAKTWTISNRWCSNFSHFSPGINNTYCRSGRPVGHQWQTINQGLQHGCFFSNWVLLDVFKA